MVLKLEPVKSFSAHLGNEPCDSTSSGYEKTTQTWHYQHPKLYITRSTRLWPCLLPIFFFSISSVFSWLM
eukprot:TRINITY_DN4876_c0_g1_i1.p1 TRINITY_DN4876_c0_g1~~TRINITY_DN4876_c0_g1_i1.p1  ORF type:complete len:70 (-),score=1.17 TRINITY_DN4876_c0_g1_i1:160-369(-)